MTLSTGPNLGVLINGALGEAHYAELMRMWRALDALIMPFVKARVATLPTSGNSEGDTYLSTSNNLIARWTTYLSTAQWEYYTPRSGWEVWSVADAKKYRYTSSGGWAEVASGGGGGSGMVNPMTSLGDIIIASDAGAPIRLGKGSTGQVLTIGSDGLPAWAASQGGGGSADEVYQTTNPGTSGTITLSNLATTIWGVALSANVTSVVLPSGFTGVKGMSILFTQDSTGNRTVAWPSKVTWNGGTAPTISPAAGAKTIVSLLSVDGGTTWLGMAVPATSSGGGSGDFKKDGSVRMTGAFNNAEIVTINLTDSLTLNAGSAQADTILVGPGGGGQLNSLGPAPGAGVRRRLIFNYAGVTLRNSGSLLLPADANIVTAIGDIFDFESTATDGWRLAGYALKSGKALVAGGSTSGDFKADGSVAMTGGFTEAPPASWDAGTGGVVPQSRLLAANTIEVAGSSAVTGMQAMPKGAVRKLRFSAANPITHNATTFILLTGASLTAAAGDMAVFESISDPAQGAAWRMINYTKADGTSLVGGSGGGDFKKDGSVQMTGPVNEAAAATLNATSSTAPLYSVASNTVALNYAGNIESFGSAPAGITRRINFQGSMTLKNSSLLVNIGGRDIVTQLGDWAEVYANGGDFWVMSSYTRKDGTPLLAGYSGGKLTKAIDEAAWTGMDQNAVINQANLLTTNNIAYTGTDLSQIGSLDNGARRLFHFTSACKITRGPYLSPPGDVDFYVRGGDVIEFYSTSPGYWKAINYHPQGAMLDNTPMLRLFTPDGTTLALGNYYAPVIDLVYQNGGPYSSLGTAPAGVKRSIVRTGRNASGVPGQDSAPITFVHDATNLALPGDRDFVMQPGDAIKFISLGGGMWEGYDAQRGTGNALVNEAASGPFALQQFTVSTLPTPVGNYGKMLLVTDAQGGPKVVIGTSNPFQWSILNTNTAVS